MNRITYCFIKQSTFLARNTQNLIKTSAISRNFCEKVEEHADGSAKLSGFAKAYEKQAESLTAKEPEETPQTFAALLRNSKFIDVSTRFILIFSFPKFGIF